MKEEQFDFIYNDFVEGIPLEIEESEYEYLSIEVIREEIAQIIVKVPKGFKLKSLNIDHIQTFCDEQSPQWESSIGIIDWWPVGNFEGDPEKFEYSEFKNS